MIDDESRISFIIFYTQMKVDKYDRQIRLWGARGQRRLGEAKVALVGCDGAGIEGLKNLVLPGLGQIDIWDDAKITVEDLSQSFFYEYDSVGSSRAEVASRNLLEMNPDVKGSYYEKNIKQFLESNSAAQYNLVIFSGQSQDEFKEASLKLWQKRVPCIFVTVIGFFFHIRLQKQLHFVESSNPNAKKFYLRITDPFPQLNEHANKVDLYSLVEKVSNIEKYEDAREELVSLSNIPYVLLLIQVYQRLSSKGEVSREMIVEELKTLRGRVHEKVRENWDEALMRILDLYQTPDNYMIDISIFDHPQVQKVHAQSHNMLKFLSAVGSLYKKTNKLPQSTSLPDMHTTTVNYISLKEIYKAQHLKDIEAVQQELGSDMQIPAELISEYINNLPTLEVVEMSPYAEELDSPKTEILNYLENQKDLLIAIRAYQNGEGYEQMREKAEQLRVKFGIDNFDDRYLQEAFRSEGKTNINIVSIAGAVIGQEAIKLITGCFTPSNNGYMFDGANGKGYSVTL